MESKKLILEICWSNGAAFKGCVFCCSKSSNHLFPFLSWENWTSAPGLGRWENKRNMDSVRTFKTLLIALQWLVLFCCVKWPQFPTVVQKDGHLMTSIADERNTTSKSKQQGCFDNWSADQSQSVTCFFRGQLSLPALFAKKATKKVFVNCEKTAECSPWHHISSCSLCRSVIWGRTLIHVCLTCPIACCFSLELKLSMMLSENVASFTAISGPIASLSCCHASTCIHCWNCASTVAVGFLLSLLSSFIFRTKKVWNFFLIVCQLCLQLHGACCWVGFSWTLCRVPHQTWQSSFGGLSCPHTLPLQKLGQEMLQSSMSHKCTVQFLGTNRHCTHHIG